MGNQTHDNLLAEFTASGQKFVKEKIITNDGHILTVFLFSHATLGFVWDNLTVYVDPLMEYADFSQLPKADAILITHDHYDHYDAVAVESASDDKTIIIGSVEVGKLNEKVRVLVPGQIMNLTPQLSIQATHAYNVSPDQLKFHPKDRQDNGYIISFDEKRIYIAGDTEPIEEMKGLGKIDVMFLPVNQPYTMTLSQAAQAAKIIGAPLFYPYHTTDTDIKKIIKLLADRPDISVRVYPMP